MSTLDNRTGAIILSGGAGTRVNGNDKGLQRYQGQELIKQVISVIMPQVDEIHICANRNISTYQALGFQIHRDYHQSYEGPMSGISSALKALIRESSLDQVLILSCDAPHLPADLRSRLESSLNNLDKQTDVTVAHDGERRQNLHCLIRRQAWPSLISFFDLGGRAMHRWLSEIDAIEVDFSESKTSFLNINTSAQLKPSRPENTPIGKPAS
jgi:molybdopterin-guanine dinucleotide biosynthesis protein A